MLRNVAMYVSVVPSVGGKSGPLDTETVAEAAGKGSLEVIKQWSRE